MKISVITESFLNHFESKSKRKRYSEQQKEFYLTEAKKYPRREEFLSKF